MGIFSDLETGTKIFLLVVFAAMIYFGGKNVFKDNKGNDNKRGGSGGSSNSGTSGVE